MPGDSAPQPGWHHGFVHFWAQNRLHKPALFAAKGPVSGTVFVSLWFRGILGPKSVPKVWTFLSGSLGWPIESNLAGLERGPVLGTKRVPVLGSALGLEKDPECSQACAFVLSACGPAANSLPGLGVLYVEQLLVLLGSLAAAVHQHG